jgi:hypothetical protein
VKFRFGETFSCCIGPIRKGAVYSRRTPEKNMTTVYANGITFKARVPVDNYFVLDGVEDLIEVRGTLDQVTAAIVAAVTRFGNPEWEVRSGYITARVSEGWVKLFVTPTLGDTDDFPSIEELDAPAKHVAAALAA